MEIAQKALAEQKVSNALTEGYREDVAVLKNRQGKADAWFKAHGVPIEDIYDE
jgi:hypothetical protein